MAVSIAVETPQLVDVRAMSAELNATMRPVVMRTFIYTCLRGLRTGLRILAHIAAFTRGTAPIRLVLETGEAPGFEPAWRLYEKAGFTICDTVLDYPDTGYSRFYKKKLA